MNRELSKKYGLPTAIAMVVGVVIGSGIFFKTESVLAVSGGNVGVGIAALLIVGAIMIICAYTFSILAGRHGHVGGVVDYAEAEVGPGYAYGMGWFVATIYFPCITSVLIWLSAMYTCQLLGIPDASTGGGCLAIAAFYLVVLMVLNSLAPVLAGKVQVSTTVIKLIPLLVMAVVGIVRGLVDGTLAGNFSFEGISVGSGSGSLLMTACVAMAFSYEGWIIATSINAELHNAKKTLPLALVVGSIVVIAVYVLYYLGINGSITVEDLLVQGSAQAYVNIFGGIMGKILVLFIVISCLGTSNGLMAAASRGIYALAARNEGPAPKLFSAVDPTTGMPHNSVFFGALTVAFWMLYFYGGPLSGWFGPISFDSSELPIITLYAGYIPMFIMMMRKERDLHPVKRFVMPALSICGCIFMVAAAIIGHGIHVLWYLLFFAVIMAVGLLLRGKGYQKPE